MKNLNVVCPSCRQVCFKTTDKYDSQIPPNGRMLEKLVPWQIDFLLSASTGPSQLTCPKCEAMLAPGGRLIVTEPVEETKQAIDETITPLDETKGPLNETAADLFANSLLDGVMAPGINLNEVNRLTTEAWKGGDPVIRVDGPVSFVEAPTVTDEELAPFFVCSHPDCVGSGKKFSTALALAGHMRSHNPKAKKKAGGKKK